MGDRRFGAGDHHQPDVAGRTAPHRIRDQSRDATPQEPERDRGVRGPVSRARVDQRLLPTSASRRHRQALLSGHARLADPGLHAVPTSESRLLHRGEGRRLDESDDERHRESPTVDPGRHQPIRAPGTHDDRHHGHPVPHQRHARRVDRPDRGAHARHLFHLVSPRLREGLPPRTRPHRQRPGRSLGVALRHPRRDGEQPTTPQHSKPPPRRGRLP